MAQDDPAVDIDLKERAMDEAPVGITISDPDRPDNPLIYCNDAFERVTGYPQEEVIGRNCRFLQGEDSDPEAVAAMRESIDAGEPVSVELRNYRRDGEPFWNEVTIAPLTDDEGRITNFVGFQDDVTARKEAELALERERQTLDRVLGRIRGLLSDVTRTLVEAESREGVERGVVQRIVDADRYGFAWIGDPDGGTIVPRAWAGEPGVAIDDFTVDLDDPDHPVARAAETHELELADDPDAAAPTWLDATGFNAIAAVPLSYGGTLYGVLAIYATGSETVDEREIAVLEALGRAIATTLNALEGRRILSADNLVELEFEVGDDDLFVVALSARCDCRLEFVGSVPEDGELTIFFRSEASPERLLDAASEVPSIEDATLLSSGGPETLVELAVAGDSLVGDLAARGVRTRSILAENGSARITVEFPAEADSRAIADRFRTRYADTELVAYRERERPPMTSGEFVAQLEDRLTDRQLTALRKAFLGGYYDSTRSTSGDELADSMGISRSTFHQHLRAAERKLVGEFLDR